MVPGTHPLEALTLTLAPHFPDRSVKTLREDLEEESARGLHLLTTQLVKAPGQKVVLLIDVRGVIYPDDVGRGATALHRLAGYCHDGAAWLGHRPADTPS